MRWEREPAGRGPAAAGAYMRIGVDATAAVRQYAGVGRFARGMLAGLARLDAHNDYVLLTMGAARIAVPPSEIPPRSTWRRLPISERAATFLWHRHALEPSPAMLLGKLSLFFTPDFALPALGTLPGIVTVHDLSFISLPECADARLRAYLCRVVPRSVRRATAIVAVSETMAKALQELLDVPPERITVLSNGVESRFFVPPQARAAGEPDPLVTMLRERFGLPPGYLLTVGTLEPRKNICRLLQAFSALRRRRAADLGHMSGADRTLAVPRHAPLTLVVAGREGWLYEPIFREFARLGLGSSVRFVTRCNDDELSALYRGARAFVYPSLYEGFGIPPLEAMASGIPVAASTGGALREVLGDAALLFDPLDIDGMVVALERVLLDDVWRAQAVVRGRARAAGYTWDASAAQALTLFERIAA